MTDPIGGVCIVTQPERSQTGKEHTKDLAEVIAHLTAVTVVTANLPDSSGLWEDHDVVEYSSTGAGEHVLVEAVRFVRNQIRLCTELRRRNEDVVLFFGTTSYVLPLLVAKLLEKKTVVLPRGDVPLSLRLRWEKRLPPLVARVLAKSVSLLEHTNYRFADAVVTYTPSMARELGLERYRGKLFTNGARYVDTDQFDVRTPFDDRGRAVGFIGRLDVEKRVPELTRAAKKLPADIRFVFVGDGAYREQLEARLAAEIDEGTVEVVGWVDREEVPEQLNRLRLLVVPSYPTEGLPTAILESMACATPAYATPVSGVPDVVREGETGFLMNAVDAGTIADEIEAILDRDDLEETSSKARGLIEAEYSFEAAVARYRDLLQTIAVDDG